MKTKKRKKRKGRRPKPVIKQGERVFILRHAEAEAKVKEIEERRAIAKTDAELEALAKEMYNVGFAWPKKVIGLLTADPDVVLSPETEKQIPGAKSLPGDTLYLESQVKKMMMLQTEKAAGPSPK